MPKPRQGTEVKEHQSIRLEPQVKRKILEKYKRIQDFIDHMIEKEGLRPSPITSPIDKKD